MVHKLPGERWRVGTWEDVAEAGAIVAQEVIRELETSLVRIEPERHAVSIEMEWPLMRSVGRSGYEAVLADPSTDELIRLWAERQIERLDRGEQLPTSGMLDEGGYEVKSYYEYGHPAPLVKGFESILDQALHQLRAGGVR